jgi:RiboL-PSP-HEPN
VSPGRRQIALLRSRLDGAFARIADIDENALEARADFARYLCVLVSGFLEQSMTELFSEHCRKQSGPRIQSFARWHLERFQNASRPRIIELAARFDGAWAHDLDAYIVDQRAAAIGSIVSERNRISHGQNSSISFVRVSEYRGPIDEVIDHVADLADPV